jgi:hypothetical protein
MLNEIGMRTHKKRELSLPILILQNSYHTLAFQQ